MLKDKLKRQGFEKSCLKIMKEFDSWVILVTYSHSLMSHQEENKIFGNMQSLQTILHVSRLTTSLTLPAKMWNLSWVNTKEIKISKIKPGTIWLRTCLFWFPLLKFSCINCLNLLLSLVFIFWRTPISTFHKKKILWNNCLMKQSIGVFWITSKIIGTK